MSGLLCFAFSVSSLPLLLCPVPCPLVLTSPLPSPFPSPSPLLFHPSPSLPPLPRVFPPRFLSTDDLDAHAVGSAAFDERRATVSLVIRRMIKQEGRIVVVDEGGDAESGAGSGAGAGAGAGGQEDRVLKLNTSDYVFAAE